MIANVKAIWERDYKPLIPPPTRTSPKPQTLLDDFLSYIDESPPTEDDFESYISAPRVIFGSHDTNNVIDWLLGPENQFPGIRQQALDLFAIPAMSTELERVFSQSKLTIVPTRNKLTEQSIQMLELLRHWWVNNLVSQERGGGGRKQRKRKAITLESNDEDVLEDGREGDSER
jgi:hypothetical protein